MNSRVLIVWVFALMVMSCGAASKNVESGEGAKTTARVMPTNPEMLRVEGNQIVDGTGAPIIFRGVAFGNNVWQDEALPVTHHNEQDFVRIKNMGMNAVRFYLNYVTFEDDDAPGKYKEAGWKWLDDNVAWAKKHGVYLVFNMHVPQGGYQSLNKGKALWDDQSAQKRLIDLWVAIAERYKDEPIVAGYDFLNEPVVSESRSQWHDLADKLISAVRKVDTNHMLFIERINGVDGDWKEDEDRNFFLVEDPNVVYEFHFYKPFHFTHQDAPWVDFAAHETSYPDESRVGVEWFLTDWVTGTHNSPTLPKGDSDWAEYVGTPFKVTGENMVIGKPTLACSNNTEGKAYFDDLVIEELNDDGSVKSELRRINPDSKRGWYFWQPKEKGEAKLESDGHGDDTSLSISGTDGDANLGAEIFQIALEQGATYRFSGWMKGENIPGSAKCQIRLDIQSSKVPLQKWDKAFLAQELDAYLAWGKKHNVPLFLGEWGSISSSFEEERGGIHWVSDMLDLLLKNKVHFTYHAYHEEYFSFYFGQGSLPSTDDANDALIQLFTERLK